MGPVSPPQPSSWLILLPQLPPQPSSLRVRVWRRLQQIGAVAVKNAAYALPDGEGTLEDFTWLRQEIVDAGGGALLLRAEALGEAGEEIRQLFLQERDEDYRKLSADLQTFTEELGQEGDLPPDALLGRERAVRQLRERLDGIRAIDFFGAPAAADAEVVLRRAEEAVRACSPVGPATVVAGELCDLLGSLWCTRAGVYVDRLACGWIILRFIDPEARFAFVRPGETPLGTAIPFDMPGVELGHHGAQCSAETIAARFRPHDAALRAVCEVVHDLDLKDEGFGRPEAPGLKRLLDGLCAATPDDTERIRLAAPLFDALYSGFQQ